MQILETGDRMAVARLGDAMDGNRFRACVRG
jgi:hypothetical protein